MVNITHKSNTLRKAIATAVVAVSSEATITAINNNQVPKGNVFEMSKTAGLFAAKRTSDMIPDCHPLPIEYTHISFEVKEGETIAIVGATGAGKTTITNLLNRFYDLTSGAIYIDGVNIEEYTLSSLREHIATVLQDVFLFADSIYNNITLKNPAITEEEVIAAAKSIGVHNFLMSLPEGYHYNVKERGVMLSAGQRQLIAFLRAYVHKPQILILDEATSSVDSHSEKLIQEATDKMTEGRTSIIIAHRLTTVKKADRIIVLDKGKIVEIGNHEELLQIENGYYRNLYEVQFLEEVKYKE